ncbi:MAG: SPOR domain-containing protein [Planctomycetota bacterium]
MSYNNRARGIVSRRVSVFLVSVCALTALILLPGCDSQEERRIEASQKYFSYKNEDASPSSTRPGQITQAYSELQGGQHSQAFTTANSFAESNPENPYRYEALYIAGQALAGQGQFQQGKDRLEVVIDKTKDRNLKALAMLGRADCNMGMEKYSLASRQYHWIQVNYKEVKALQQDEVMFKLGLASKKANNIEWADYWFNQVNELYHTGPYAERARQENSRFTPPPDKNAKPLQYYLEAYEYSRVEKAEESATMLRSKGYRDVEVVPTTRNTKPVYEVRVGKFLNRAAAGRAQVDAELAGLSTSVRPGMIEPLK